MKSEERVEVFHKLAAPFPESCVQRTEGRLTGRGYDTTGIGYQHVVNRMNEVLGVGGFRVTRTVTVKEVVTAKGRPAYEATCEVHLQLGEWLDGVFVPFAEAIGDGGHVAMMLADAIKGAYTNGFKKTAAFFGAGRQAYEGSLDDDNVPAEAMRPPARTPARAVTSATVAENPPPGSTARSDAAGVGPIGTTGRVTSAQLAKLRELVAEAGEEWAAYRALVREKHGVNVEYADRALASTLITERVSGAQRRRQNGGENGHRRSR